MFGKKEQTSQIQKLVSSQLAEDKYILDDENAIMVIKNNDTHTHSEHYIMIHQRLQNGRLVEINRCYINSYYFGTIHDRSQIKELNLFKIQNGCGTFDALYDYKNGKFVVPQGVWREIITGRNNEILNKYNGFLATFEISADYEEGDVFSYINPMTNEKMVASFGANDGSYYAIINIDGTIRSNKLFKGNSFSRISQIIDLDKYESLDAFKQERKQICNAQKQKEKQEYQKMIETRNDGSISPYLDSEVAKVLDLKI